MERALAAGVLDPDARRLLVDLAGRLEDPSARRLLLAGLADPSPRGPGRGRPRPRRRRLPRGAASPPGPQVVRPVPGGPARRRGRPAEAAAAVRFPPVDHDAELPEEEFRLLRDFVHERFGLFFDDSQRASLRSRLAPRLALLGLVSFEDYYRYLRFAPERAQEQQRMVSHLTNNETYFFREQPQLEVFSTHVLRELKERKSRAEREAPAPALRGLLDRRGAADPRHDPVRQRPVLLGLGREGHRPRRGRGGAGEGAARRLSPELAARGHPARAGAALREGRRGGQGEGVDPQARDLPPGEPPRPLELRGPRPPRRRLLPQRAHLLLGRGGAAGGEPLPRGARPGGLPLPRARGVARPGDERLPAR